MDTRIRLAIIPTLAVIGVVAALLYGLDSYVKYQIRGYIVEDLTYAASTAASAVAAHGIRHDMDRMDKLADELGKSTNTRITIIMYDGVVLGDSERSVEQVRAMENHLHRPEVQVALSKGLGMARHYSATLGTEMLYVAVRQQVGIGLAEKSQPDGILEHDGERHFHVVRAAIDEEEVGRRLYPIQMAFIAVAILGAIMIFGIGLALSSKISRKLSEATGQLEAEVEKRTRDIAMLQRLGSSLGACANMDEAGDVIRLIVGRILPGTRGGVYITKASRNLEELLVSWGDGWDGAQVFAPSQCWAMRKGRSHRSNEEDLAMLCQHLESQAFTQSLCIPLVAQGESLGTFTILTDETDWRTEDVKMAQTLAEQMSIILASLQFREDLRQQAIRDPLTGLFNRRYLMEALFQSIGRADRQHSQVSALMIDIDNFKRFNDTYGHDIGDLVLQRIAAEIKHCTRKEDILSRYGGEEFCLVCPDLNDKAAMGLGERLCEQVRRLTLDVNSTKVSNFSISVGIAIYPQHSRNGEDLLKVADEALYQAKAQGKNHVILASNQPKDSMGSSSSADIGITI
ncbi:MAG: diguanylate cyclase [Chromatiales bacterium]|jgi:diguanylate cyclase (GGDEF)-like protein